MDALSIINIHKLMNKTQGNPKIIIGLVDGPIYVHSEFEKASIETIQSSNIYCKNIDNKACKHGTFIAGILCSKRGIAPGICPKCTLLLRPIFNEFCINCNTTDHPNANPEELVKAIKEVIDQGARIINLSIGTTILSTKDYRIIYDAYDYALKHDVIIVISAGNSGNMGRVTLIDHSWIIPVTACDEKGLLYEKANFGRFISRRGVMAPGKNIISTLAGGGYSTRSGTSFAAPFVTGKIALLWSIFPNAKARDILNVIVPTKRKSIIPYVLNAEESFRILKSNINK